MEFRGDRRVAGAIELLSPWVGLEMEVCREAGCLEDKWAEEYLRLIPSAGGVCSDGRIGEEAARRLKGHALLLLSRSNAFSHSTTAQQQQTGRSFGEGRGGCNVDDDAAQASARLERKRRERWSVSAGMEGAVQPKDWQRAGSGGKVWEEMMSLQ